MRAAEQHLLDVPNEEHSEPPNDVQASRAKSAAARAAAVIDFLSAEVYFPDLWAVHGVVQHVREGEDTARCDETGWHHHFCEVLLDPPAGAPEWLVAEADDDTNDALLEAVLSAIGRRVVAIVAAPTPGPWGRTDGTIVALIEDSIDITGMLEVAICWAACGNDPFMLPHRVRLPTPSSY